MTELDRLAGAVAHTVGDYRRGELAPPTPDHVGRWVCQFPSDVRVPLLKEIDYVLKRTYFDKDRVAGFLRDLATNEKLVKDDSRSFWQTTNILDIQENGHSQRDMLALLDTVLQELVGTRVADCGKPGGSALYIDDILFSGSRVGNDLSAWCAAEAPASGHVDVVLIGSHTFGQYKMGQRVQAAAVSVGKRLDISVWYEVLFENRNAYRNSSEVLWPSIVPADPALATYMKTEQKFPFQPRQAGGKLAFDVFSSEQGRQLLERELLMAGVRIRSFCRNPKAIMRPLGFSPFGLGFGSMVATFRNCPNNCPLAIWWGDPSLPPSSPLSKWYPLLPRKTYSQDADYDDWTF